MSVVKRLIERGEVAYPIPGHAGWYRLSDDRAWSRIGTGPRPHYRPTRDALIEHGINPTAFARDLLAIGGPDMTAELASTEPSPKAGQLSFF